MLGARPKSAAADAKSGKGTPPTPKGSRASKPGPAKPTNGTPQPARRGADRSPGSVDKPPSGERRSPKVFARLSTPPAEKQGSAVKQSQELQAQFAAVQEELKRAKEHLVEKEKEKGKVLEELEDAKRLAEEANANLLVALAARKKAEEASETEMFRAVELEQTSIESMQWKEEELQRKLESMRIQQESDAAALRSTVEQLEKARYELADAIDAKNLALNQADDATRLSEVNAHKVELLDAEVSRLKELLDTELESKEQEAEQIRRLEAEASALKIKLEKAKFVEEKIVELEGVIEGLRADVANATKAKTEAEELADEWKQKAELLEIKLEEANQSYMLKVDSLNSVIKELDAASALLAEKESELSDLHNKLQALEDEVARQNEDIDASNERLDVAEKEAFDLKAEIKELQSKLQALEEEKMDAINSENNASSQIESLCEEKEKLAMELEVSKDEYEKVKKAMEDLASALHEMSGEARAARERYLNKQEEIERAREQIEELNMNLKNTQENYEVMLDEANYERVCLKKTVERMEAEAKNTSEEWQSKEVRFVSSINKSVEEINAMRIEMDKAAGAARGWENRNAELEEKLKELEAQVEEANRAKDEAKAEALGWKEKLLDRENELQNIKQENDDLQVKESTTSEKIKELSSMLGNAKDRVLNGTGPKDESDKGNTKEDDPVVVVAKMWENSKVTDYDLSTEKEKDGESELDLESNKGDVASGGRMLSIDKMNNSTKLAIKPQQQKKPLMKKFGGLLKKKGQH
ncbi:WEB family protein At3g02930, chloroplastic-like [Phragmites australis]|uniref:WEB family protein At3g02930, chloroplastic-like n=1 Tax=Phragmites australis TaxID=29695 RepID=UPI002D777C48|nr:WEB family protein At3g02930, chloroplastic-like [Phragmites australis]